MKLPSKVKVGVATYTLTESPALVGIRAYGLTFESGGRRGIQLQPGMPPALALHTLLHELMHAIHYEYGMHNTEDVNEEFICDTVGHGFAQIFMDNPKLLEYVVYLSCLKD